MASRCRSWLDTHGTHHPVPNISHPTTSVLCIDLGPAEPGKPFCRHVNGMQSAVCHHSLHCNAGNWHSSAVLTVVAIGSAATAEELGRKCAHRRCIGAAC